MRVRKLLVGEVFRAVESASTKAEKIKILKANSGRGVKQILKLAYDKSCVPSVDLSKELKSEHIVGFGDTSIDVESSRMYIFFDTYQKMNPKKRQDAFETLVISLDQYESELLLKACTKKLKLAGLTPSDIAKTFPGLIEKKVSA